MKKNFIKFAILSFVCIVTVSVTMFALPAKTYVTNCIQPVYDIQQVTVMDNNADGHYETCRTIWCNVDSNTTDTLYHPIVVENPSVIRGKPMNDYALDPFPWQSGYRPVPVKPSKPKFSLIFTLPGDPTTIVYTYQLNEDDPTVYYNQYQQINADVASDDLSGNGMTISPNPATSDATLNFFLLTNTFVKVEIFTMNGQSAGVIDNDFHSNGKQDIRINTQQLISGIYLVKTTIGTTTFVNKLNVIK